MLKIKEYLGKWQNVDRPCLFKEGTKMANEWIFSKELDLERLHLCVLSGICSVRF